MAGGHEPIVQAWKGEVFYAILRDEKGTGVLGRARETLVVLSRTRLKLKGRRWFGLSVDMALADVTKVTPRVVPALTLDVHYRTGRVEIPAGAHDFVELQILGEKIEEAARVVKAMLRQQVTGEAAMELEKLVKIMGRDRDGR